MNTNPVANRRARLLAVTVLAVTLGGCMISVGGPDDNREEQFEFTPVPATRLEAVEAFRGLLATDSARLVEDSVVPVGKLRTGQGSVVFADFELIDPDTGLNVCSGSAGPNGGGWGCRPAAEPAPDDRAPRDHLQNAVVGSTGTWSEAEFSVNDEVDHLIAVAEDGTTYRMEPLQWRAWMEWKTEHGDLVVTAFDAEGRALSTVDVEAR